MGDLAGDVGRSISGLIEGVVRATQDAVQGVWSALNDVAPLPIILVGGFLLLVGLAWFLAKR
jgi:hypothetical protein